MHITTYFQWKKLTVHLAGETGSPGFRFIVPGIFYGVGILVRLFFQVIIFVKNVEEMVF